MNTCLNEENTSLQLAHETAKKEIEMLEQDQEQSTDDLQNLRAHLATTSGFFCFLCLFLYANSPHLIGCLFWFFGQCFRPQQNSSSLTCVIEFSFTGFSSLGLIFS